MKISKYVKLVKETGRCIVADVAGDGIWLGNGYALYRATGLPWMEGDEQVRTVLDVPEKSWKKIYLQQEHFENIRDVMGLNLADYDDQEQQTEKVRVAAAPDGLWASCRRCADGELIFYQEGLLAPFMDEIKDSDYIIYTVRRMANGQRYLMLHDGMNVLAAIMPMKVVSEEYLASLAEFEALCTEQLYRERARAAALPTEAEPPEAEQIGMEDGKE